MKMRQQRKLKRELLPYINFVEKWLFKKGRKISPEKSGFKYCLRKNPIVRNRPFAVGYCRFLSFLKTANSFYECEYHFEIKFHDNDMSMLQAYFEVEI